MSAVAPEKPLGRVVGGVVYARSAPGEGVVLRVIDEVRSDITLTHEHGVVIRESGPVAVATLVEHPAPTMHVATQPARRVSPSRWRRPTGWVIVSIVLAEAIASLRLGNSAFQDESLYLWAGHQITAHLAHGSPVYGNFSSYFSGSPGVYPVVASLVDGVWGLAGARAMSLAWMVLATLCVYGITRRLFGSRYGAPAAAAFSLSAPILFIGHLATFDAMCLGLLALATYASVRAAATPRLWWAMAVGPIAVLAVLTKYAGALFVPSIFAVLVLESIRRRGPRAAATRATVAAAAGVALVALVIRVFGTSALVGLRATTTNRTVLLRSHAWPLISESMRLGGLFAAVALVGWFLLPRRQRLLGAVLFGTVLLAPAYHVLKGEPVSLAKHVGFGLFFAAPLVGRALGDAAGQLDHHLSGPRFATALVVGLVLIATGLTQSSSLSREWPNSDALVVTLKSLVRPGSGRVLAEEAEVPRYRLRRMLQPWQWSDLNWFEYTDHQGVHLTGLDAYRAAIDERYFDVIELRYGPNAGTAVAIRDDIKRAGGYQLVAQLPFTTTLGSGAYSLWRLASPSAPRTEIGSSS